MQTAFTVLCLSTTRGQIEVFLSPVPRRGGVGQCSALEWGLPWVKCPAASGNSGTAGGCLRSRGNNRLDLSVSEEGRSQVLSAVCLEFEMSTREAVSPGLTVGLVSGGRVRCRSTVDDGVRSEVGELRDGSQQTACIFFFFFFSKEKTYSINM